MRVENIGPHTLIQGDALEVLPGLIPGRCDAVVTDPPYSSGGQYRSDRVQKTMEKYVQNGYDTGRQFGNFSGDNRDQRSMLAWSSLWLTAAGAACSDGAVLCMFTDWRQLPTMTDAVQAGGWTWRNLCTWHKPGIRMQKGRFSGSAEYVVYGTWGPHASDGQASPQNVFTCAPIVGQDKIHIAEKPLPVLAWLVSVTRPGGLVLDPFMGSGVAAVACIQSGRQYIGIEKDPAIFETALRRVEDELKRPTLFEPPGMQMSIL